MKRYGERIALIIIGILCGLSISEILMRNFFPQVTGSQMWAFDQMLGDIPIKNQNGHRTMPGVYDYTYSNDSLGMRVTPGSQNSERAFPVLFLGDSFTYGLGVDDDHTFAAIVQRNAMKHVPIRILNGGTIAKGTDYELRFLQVHGAILKPKIVAVFFYGNDFDDNGHEIYFTDVDGKFIPKNPKTLGGKKQFLMNNPIYAWLVERSHLANLIKLKAVDFFSEKPQNLIRPINPLGRVDEHNFNLTRRYLLELSRAIQAMGAQAYFFYVPSRGDIDSESGQAQFEKDALSVFAKAHIPLISLKAAFSEGVSVDNLYFSEGHWTAKAHYEVAEYLTDLLLPIIRNTIKTYEKGPADISRAFRDSE